MSSSHEFAKHIPSYLDGMMSDSERLDFEARMARDIELARLFRQKQTEQNSLVARVPQTELSAEVQESLEIEVRETIDNLFKDEDAPAAKRVKSWFAELF